MPDPNSWSRSVNTTIAKFVRGEEVNILRNRRLLALLQKKGRFTFNWSGEEMVWRARYKRVKMQGYAEGDTQDFARKDRWKTARLPWRGYVQNDSMFKPEMLKNRGTEAIVSTYSNLAKYIMEDMEDQFGEEYYLDGNAAGNTKRMHGIESFMQATTNAGNGGASPTGSFAGLSCVPGFYGGNWNGGSFNGNANNGWPNGRGDASFDFWSPIVVDYGDAEFDPTTHTWANNCVEAISYLIIKTKKSKSVRGQLDMVLTNDENWRTYIKVMRTKERIVVERANDQSPLIALGFKDVINQDGCDVTWEYGMVPNVSYGFNCNEMETRSMQDRLFVPEGPFYDESSKSHRFSVDMLGNTYWNPKFFGKLANLTNPSDS